MVLAAPHPYALIVSKSRPAYNQAEPQTPLGKFLRAERDRRGWGQEEVAARANIPASEVSNLEVGRRGVPHPPRMIALARAFGIPVVMLYTAAGFPEFIEWVGTITDDEISAMRERIRQDLSQG